VSGLTVLPGFIDSHVHLFPTGSSSGIDSDAALAQFIRDELPARLRNYLERGVTTVFSVGDAWPAVRDLRRRIEAGEISAPRLLLAASQSTIASHIVHISPNLPTRK
jgi:imidazolonepropionase-like amidohydrolase